MTALDIRSAIWLVVLSLGAVLDSGVASTTQTQGFLRGDPQFGMLDCDSMFGPADSLASVRLLGIAQEMYLLATEAIDTLAASTRRRGWYYEGGAKDFVAGAANIAETAVGGNPYDYRGRLLLGRLLWLLADRGGAKIDVPLATDARRHILCALEHANAAGDTNILVDAQERLANIDYFLVEHPRMQDSAYVANSIRPYGFTHPDIKAKSGAYYSIVAEKTANSGRYLLVLERQSEQSFSMMLEPRHLEDRREPSLLEWISLDGDTVADGLVVEYLDETGTGRAVSVYRIAEGHPVATYNGFGHPCAETALTDLDGDGKLELLTYSLDSAESDCDDACNTEIEERFSVRAGWPELRRWDGTRWSLETTRFRRFYSQLARRYDEVILWLTDAPDGHLCVRLLHDIERWAARARRIVEGDN